MQQATKIFQFLSNEFTLTFGNFSLPIKYWEVLGVILLLFMLVLLLGHARRKMNNWSFRGVIFGVFFGFLMALTIEGFLIIGGKTALTQVLGWKNPPAPVAQVLDAGRGQLVKVLGAETQIPSVNAMATSSAASVIENYQSLTSSEAAQIKSIICKP